MPSALRQEYHDRFPVLLAGLQALEQAADMEVHVLDHRRVDFHTFCFYLLPCCRQ